MSQTRNRTSQPIFTRTRNRASFLVGVAEISLCDRVKFRRENLNLIENLATIPADRRETLAFERIFHKIRPLGIFFHLFSNFFSCWLARNPRKTSVGIALAVLLAVFLEQRHIRSCCLFGICFSIRANRFLASNLFEPNPWMTGLTSRPFWRRSSRRKIPEFPANLVTRLIRFRYAVFLGVRQGAQGVLAP